MARPVVTDRRTALVAGLLCVVAGSWLLSQAFEARGRSRPLWARIVTAAS
ncbi:hypothetical protein [Cellulomonas sp. 73-145]|nr:hypothetical protein [Cellulomonas sp. 73-145]MBN9327733.1 hypothetical protein [Cellulomonas sp.]